jgi:adenylate cyclase
MAAAVAAVLLGCAWPDLTTRRWREAATDALLLALPAPADAGQAGADPRVMVVDIDRETLAATGGWPWPRDRLAGLVQAIARTKPAAIGIDILLAGDQPGDDALRASFAGAPVVLGALMADVAVPGAPPPAGAPIALQGTPPSLSPWSAPAFDAPGTRLAAKAAATGIAALAADTDGRVRRVPVFAVAGDTVLAGFAFETVRVAAGAGVFMLDGDAALLRIGRHALPLVTGAEMRVRPTPAARWQARTIPARILDADPAGAAAALAGRIVLIGSSAPELGALRQTAAGPVTPDVQVQADAVATILSGRVPWRPPSAGSAEVALALFGGLLAALAGAWLQPLRAALATAGIGLSAALASFGALAFLDRVTDPVGPPLVALAAGAASRLVSAQQSRRASSALRRRFEQYLAPGVVARIAAAPDLVKLAGERREVTVLCTDIEGFSALTEALGPEALVATLDSYFETVVACVVDNGGMVDKIVGDAVVALFNAPVDLPGHAARAVAAAFAIRDATEALRGTPTGAALGRTRIGVETGLAIVGDVGARGKLDYTAYGLPVNMAARLEALNKTLGTAICIGPGTRAACPGLSVRSHGPVEVRGSGTFELYEPLAPG